jgi:hypothetical protein
MVFHLTWRLHAGPWTGSKEGSFFLELVYSMDILFVYTTLSDMQQLSIRQFTKGIHYCHTRKN